MSIFFLGSPQKNTHLPNAPFPDRPPSHSKRIIRVSKVSVETLGEADIPAREHVSGHLQYTSRTKTTSFDTKGGPGDKIRK